MNETRYTSVEDYLDALRSALQGADAALVQDALYDTEDHLRTELAEQPTVAEAAALEGIVAAYGTPAEVAEAYRNSERTVNAALRAPPSRPASGLLGRFFGVYSDSRAWLALFYMLLSLVTGTIYFITVITGLSLSAGLALLIIGLPFFLLFIGFTRILSLTEGRIVEGLLGVRMPRRPLRPAEGTWFNRVREMLVDRRTWTTLLYQIAMMPLGIAYFTCAVTGLGLSIGFILAPALAALQSVGLAEGIIQVDGWQPTVPTALMISAAGIVLLTSLLHAARGLGHVHGLLARSLLLSRRTE